MMELRNPLLMRQCLVTDRGDPMLLLNEKQGHNNLSLETMKQNVESRSFVNRGE